MQETNTNYIQDNKNTKQQAKLINGILGEEKITYTDLAISLKEFRPHYTNCKYNTKFKSSFNSKFIVRYEHLSFLKKTARFNSQINNRLILLNAILIIIVKISEKFGLFSEEITLLSNLAIFAIIGFFIYKVITVKKSIKCLNKANVATTGGISIRYLFVLVTNFLILFPVIEISNFNAIKLAELLPLVISLILIVVINYKLSFVMPVITNEDRIDEKKSANIRFTESMQLMTENVVFDRYKKQAILKNKTFDKVIYLNKHSVEDKQITKFISRRKGR